MGGATSSPSLKPTGVPRCEEDGDLPQIRLIMKEDLALNHFSEFLLSISDSMPPFLAPDVYKVLYSSEINEVVRVESENETCRYPECEEDDISMDSSSVTVDSAVFFKEFIGLPECNVVELQRSLQVKRSRLASSMPKSTPGITLLYMMKLLSLFKESTYYESWMRCEATQSDNSIEDPNRPSDSSMLCHRIINNINRYKRDLLVLCDDHRYISVISNILGSFTVACFITLSVNGAQQYNPIIYANPVMTTLTGYANEELVGFTPQKLMHQDSHRDFRRLNISKVGNSGHDVMSFAVRFTHKNGHPIDSLAFRVVAMDSASSEVHEVLAYGILLDTSSPNFLSELAVCSHIAEIMPRALSML